MSKARPRAHRTRPGACGAYALAALLGPGNVHRAMVACRLHGLDSGGMSIRQIMAAGRSLGLSMSRIRVTPDARLSSLYERPHNFLVEVDGHVLALVWSNGKHFMHDTIQTRDSAPIITAWRVVRGPRKRCRLGR